MEWIGETPKCCNSPWRFPLHERELSGNLLAQKRTRNQLLSANDLHPKLVFFLFPRSSFNKCCVRVVIL